VWKSTRTPEEVEDEDEEGGGRTVERLRHSLSSKANRAGPDQDRLGGRGVRTELWVGGLITPYRCFVFTAER